jgi:hemoglobin
MMVVEYVRYELPDSECAEFRDRYREAGLKLSADENCLSWDLTQGVEETGRHTVRIVWTSQEGHESGFRATDGYQEFLSLLRPFRSYITEMGHHRWLLGDRWVR